MEGNITATVYSLVLSEDNSSEIVVTVETNSKESPDTLTNLLTRPLEQRLQEFSNIDEQFMFRIVTTERHGMFHDVGIVRIWPVHAVEIDVYIAAIFPGYVFFFHTLLFDSVK